MALKTLHLTNFWHPSSGGVSAYYRALLEAGNRCRRQVRLVAPGAGDAVEDTGAYSRLYTVRAPRAPLNGAYRLIPPQSYLAPQGAVRRILDAERPDVVEICDKYTLPYLGGLLRLGALIRGYRPAVIGLTCERFDENVAAYFRPMPALSRVYMKWLYFPLCDHHIAVSWHTAGELKEASRGHKVQRGVWVSSHGVEVTAFSPSRRTAAVRQELLDRTGGGGNATLLLYAGRLVPEKNLGLLIDAFEILVRRGDADWRLVIAGEGVMRAELERQCARRFPGRAAFLGHVGGRDALAALYANADIFVHPNPREPFGIAPLEAMASGLPLVAPNCGGITAYANESNAWLVEPDAASFASAVSQVLADPECRRRRTAAARATAEQHSWDAVTDRFFSLYEELHARVRGSDANPSLEPAFFSTAGDWLGFEVRQRAVPGEAGSGLS